MGIRVLRIRGSTLSNAQQKVSLLLPARHLHGATPLAKRPIAPDGPPCANMHRKIYLHCHSVLSERLQPSFSVVAVVLAVLMMLLVSLMYFSIVFTSLSSLDASVTSMDVS